MKREDQPPQATLLEVSQTPPTPVSRADARSTRWQASVRQDLDETAVPPAAQGAAGDHGLPLPLDLGDDLPLDLPPRTLAPTPALSPMRAYQAAVNRAVSVSAELETARKSIGRRAELRELRLKAVAAANAAGIPRSQLCQDLGLGRGQVSLLVRAVELDAAYRKAGVLPHPAVSLSHLEALLTVEEGAREAVVREIQAKQLTVADLRQLVKDRRPRPEDPEPIRHLRQHLGPYLRGGWERRVDELIAELRALTSDDVWIQTSNRGVTL